MQNFFAFLKIFFTIIFYILAIFWVGVVLYFDGISGVLLLLFALTLSAMFAWAFRLTFKKLQEKPFHRTMQSIFVSVFAIFGILFAISGYFVVYHNILNPAKLANITLENSSGQKVVFVKMSHIATPKFFTEKNNSLRTLAGENFIILEEGVGAGSEDSHNRVNALMGFDFSSLWYSRIAGAFGLAEQSDSLYDGVNPEQIKNVDLSLDRVMELVGTGSVEQEAGLSGNELDETLRQLEMLNDRQKVIVHQIVLSFLNFFIKVSDEILELQASSQNGDIQTKFLTVILHERNTPIAEEIITNPDKNYAVVYGALHFNGVYKLLKENDATWNITKVESFLPYRQ